MAVLGEAYRIMYISAGRTSGLTDVEAVVLKPDLSQAGVFPLAELGGLFHGCYYYDYLSSTSDPEGQYFSRVISLTEDIEDIVRFQLLPGSGGSGDNAIVVPPTAIFATVTNEELSALMIDDNDLWTYIKADQVRSVVKDEDAIHAIVSDIELTSNVNSNSTVVTTGLDI